jgi:hypothetical protein
MVVERMVAEGMWKVTDFCDMQQKFGAQYDSSGPHASLGIVSIHHHYEGGVDVLGAL